MIRIYKLFLKDVMVVKPITIRIGEPFHIINDLFKKHGIRHLLVVDGEDKLKGVVSEKGLYRVVSPLRTTDGEWVYDQETLDNFKIEDAMNADPSSLKPGDTLGAAMSLIIKEKLRCIPIIDEDNKVLGIVTPIDVLKAVQEYFL